MISKSNFDWFVINNCNIKVISRRSNIIIIVTILIAVTIINTIFFIVFSMEQYQKKNVENKSEKILGNVEDKLEMLDSCIKLLFISY